MVDGRATHPLKTNQASQLPFIAITHEETDAHGRRRRNGTEVAHPARDERSTGNARELKQRR